jgi:hypothetical protein
VHTYFISSFIFLGDHDCKDISDEQSQSAPKCYQQSSSFGCDDRLCYRDQFSCGDGECIPHILHIPFQTIDLYKVICRTLRDYLHQCELHPLSPLWTSKSGRCLSFTQYNITLNEVINFNSWSNETKCSWLIKCAFLRVRAPWCSCFGNDCGANITNICRQSFIIHPPGRLFNTLTYTAYARNRTNWFNRMPEAFFVSGSLKCRGFHLTFKKDEIGPLLMNNEYILSFHYDSYWCNFNISLQHRNRTSLAPHYKLNCQRDASTFTGKRYAFNDVCETSRECISNHRLLDNFKDCYDLLDEKMSNKTIPTCLSNKHRFHCSVDQPTCYLVKELQASSSVCANKHDVYLYGTGTPMLLLPCIPINPADCTILRDYIQNHETFIPPVSIIPYVHYCDTFWDIDSKIDESPVNCREWVCPLYQYQCLTGQCIPISLVCDEKWDCPDASDEQGVFAFDHLSHHNQRFFNLSVLHAKCNTRYPEHQQPFHTKCNRSIEYPCLLANVRDPTDIHTNRPCIPLSKIGDNVIDCYGGLDERNILTSCYMQKSMQNFDLYCPDSQRKFCVSYGYLCILRDKCDEPICFFRRGVSNGSCSKQNDFLCLDGKCITNARCNRHAECTNGEDEYWCDYLSLYHTIMYRFLDLLMKPTYIMPVPSLAISRRLVLEPINDRVAFACNRGIAIRKSDTIICLCPPAYYGLNCEFNSDRLTFIIKNNLMSSGIIIF